MTEAKDAEIDRNTVEKFLLESTKILRSDVTRAMLKDTSSGRPGMELVNETQDNVWDELGVSSKPLGRRAVEMAEHLYPGDSAILALRADFAKASDEAFWQCLEDRRPSKLETEAQMPRNVLLDFFVAVCCKLSTPEVKERLRANIEKTASFPGTVIDGLLGEILETLGFEKKHGEQCYKALMASPDIAKDPALVNAHRQWNARIEHECLTLLSAYRKKEDASELMLHPEMASKLLDFEAEAQLDAMSPQDRGELLAKKWKES